MKEHYYKGNKIVEYSSNDFVGFYFVDEELNNMERAFGKTLEEVQRYLDKYDKRSKMS